MGGGKERKKWVLQTTHKEGQCLDRSHVSKIILVHPQVNHERERKVYLWLNLKRTAEFLSAQSEGMVL